MSSIADALASSTFACGWHTSARRTSRLTSTSGPATRTAYRNSAGAACLTVLDDARTSVAGFGPTWCAITIAQVLAL